MKLFFILVNILATTIAYKAYTGYKLVQIKPNGEAQLAAIRSMEGTVGFEVDYWTEPSTIGKRYVFSVSPTQFPAVTKYLSSRRIEYKVPVDDLSKLIQRSYLDLRSFLSWSSTEPETFDFSKYHPHDEQVAFLRAVAEKYPEVVEIGTLGKSFELREIPYLKIGYPSPAPKDIFLIDAGIHAREWISSATALYLINQLVTDPKYTKILEEIDFVIVPNLNPDGYEYSRIHDRLWRKTRSGPTKGCYGVDPNRNFPFKWGYSGTSNNPCSEVYRGQAPLSEIECANLARYMEANNASIKAYVTLHSYGQNIIYPWGYETHTYPDDVNELKDLGLATAEAIRGVFGKKYNVGGSADSLYPASGASDDYGKSLGVKYVYTFELRPATTDIDSIGYYGFELPPKYIVPTAQEVSTGIMAMAEKLIPA